MRREEDEEEDVLVLVFAVALLEVFEVAVGRCCADAKTGAMKLTEAADA